MEKYLYLNCNSEYIIFYNLEKDKIKKIIKGLRGIEHIDSTSVKGLGGKGIIDIAIGVEKTDFDFFLKSIRTRL